MIVGVVLDYNDASRTERCVRSLLDNDVSRVLIWENSDDQGASQRILARTFASDKRVMITGVGVNIGFSAGVNSAMKVVADELGDCRVLIINNDAVLLSGAASEMSRAMCNSGAAIVYPDIDHAGRRKGKVYYQTMTGILAERKLPGSVLHASGCCMLVDARVFFGGPLFDPDFFMYGEDVELGARVASTGVGMVHVPELLVSHEVSASSRAGSMFYESRMVLAHLMLADKLGSNLLARIAGHLCRMLVLPARAVVRALRFRQITPWQGLAVGYHLYWRWRAGNGNSG